MLLGRGIEAVYGIAKVFKRNPGQGGTGKLVQWGVAQAYVASVQDV